MGTVLEITLRPTSRRRARSTAPSPRWSASTRCSRLRPASDVSPLNAHAPAAARRAPAAGADLLASLGRPRARDARGLRRDRRAAGALWNEAARRGRRPIPPRSPPRARAAAAASASMQRRGGRDRRARRGRPRSTSAASRRASRSTAARAARRPASTTRCSRSARAASWRSGRPATPTAGGCSRGTDGGYAGVLDAARPGALRLRSARAGSGIGGARYGHVIDPRSGRPLKRNRAAPWRPRRHARGGALSKALLVLGPSEGIALIEGVAGRRGAAARRRRRRRGAPAAGRKRRASNRPAPPGPARAPDAGFRSVGAWRNRSLHPARSARRTCRSAATRSPVTSSSARAAARPGIIAKKDSAMSWKSRRTSRPPGR